MAARRRISFAVSPELDKWLTQQANAGGFESPADYIQHLLRLAQVSTDADGIDRQLLDALESGTSRAVTARDWAALKRRGDARIAEIRKRSAKAQRRRSA